jgi:Ca2+-binding EF-hand superfamily protein
MGEFDVFSPAEQEEFQAAFHRFRPHKSARVKTQDLKKLVRAVGFLPREDELEDMIEDLGSSEFDFGAFMYILSRHARQADPEGELLDSFKIVDKAGTGKLPVDKIREVLSNLRTPFTEEQIIDVIQQTEVDSQDQIDYAEFAKILLVF